MAETDSHNKKTHKITTRELTLLGRVVGTSGQGGNSDSQVGAVHCLGNLCSHGALEGHWRGTSTWGKAR